MGNWVGKSASHLQTDRWPVVAQYLPDFSCRERPQIRRSVKSFLSSKTHLYGSVGIFVLFAFGCPVTVSAQQYWDGTDTSANADGGAGTWDAATTNWDSAETGGADQAWADGDAVFGGTAGTVTVSGTRTVTGITFSTDGYTVSGGTLAVGGATIDSGSGTSVISSILTGSGLTKTGTGTLTISGTSALTGTFTVGEGDVKLGAGALSGTLANLDVQDNIGPSMGTQVNLDLGGNTVTTSNFIVNGVGTTELSNGTLSFSGTGQIGKGTVSADLTGGGNLTKLGSSTAILTGTNTYTGTTTVQKNTLSLAAGSSIASTTVIIGDGSTDAKPVLIAAANTLASGTNLTIDTIAGSGGEFRNEGDNTIATLNDDAGATTTLNGGTLTITGGGTVAGVVAGSGNLTVNGGTLALSNTANTAGGTLTVSTGTLVLGSWGGSVNNSSVVDLQSTAAVSGTFTNSGTITNSTNGAFGLTGLDEFVSNGTINAGSGSLNVSAANVTFQNGYTSSGTVTFTGSGTLTEERTAGNAPAYSGDYGSTNLATNAAGVFATSGSVTTTGNFTQNSSETVTIAAGDTLTAGTITVNAGSGGISVGAGSTLAGTGNTLNNAAFIAVAAGGSVTDAGAVNNLAAGTITFADGGTLAADTDVSGDEGISNAGTLNINGTSTVTASTGGSGIFSNTGTTTVAAGATLSVAGIGATGLTNASGGLLTLNGALTGNLSALAGSTTNVASTGSVSGTTTNAGTLSSGGTLTGAVTNTGALTLSGGSLGATLDNAGTGTVNVTGSTSVTGNVTNTSASATAVTVAAGMTLTTPLLDNDAGTVALNGALVGALDNASGATVNVASTGSVSGTSTNAGTMSSGGTLTGAVANTGALTLSGGSLGATLGNAGTGTVNVTGSTSVTGNVTNTSASATAVTIAAGMTLATPLLDNDAGTVALNGALVGALDNASGATVNVASTGSVSGTTTNAGTLTSAGATFSGMTNNSTFNAFGATLLGGSFSNTGVTSMENGTTGDTLTVNGNLSGGGQINLDVDYTDATADSLIVNGSTSGTNSLQLTSVTGGDPTIGDDISLISVTGTTTDNDFELLGGPIVAGVYSFDLARTGGDWSLRGYVNARGEAYETTPVALTALLDMPSLEQRRGQTGNLAASEQGRQLADGAWGRVFASRNNFSMDSSISGADVDGEVFGVQLGYDQVVSGGLNGEWILGFTGQFGSVKNSTSVSSVESKNVALGVTATWFGSDGWYADGQMQVSWLDSSFSALGAGLADGENSNGLGFSAEVGKRVMLSETSAIVPQAQIEWSQVGGLSFVDDLGGSVSFGEIQSTRGRLGVAFEHFNDARSTKIYAIGSILHDFSADNMVIVDASSLEVGDLGTWADFGLGISKNWGENRKFYAEMSSRKLLSGGDGSGFGVSAGIEIRM
jgi:outer membrane autotransporter protein